MSAPVPWDHDTVVKRMRTALEGIGGKNGLRASADVRARSVMVTNYDHALRHGLYPEQVKALIAMQADTDRECWEAIVIIEAMALSGDMMEAERYVKRTIGNCPGKRKGRDSSTLMPRNEFIHDGIEVLQDKDVGDMKLYDAIVVMADVLDESEDVIIKARQTYIRMMEWNRELLCIARFIGYRYEYERLCLLRSA